MTDSAHPDRPSDSVVSDATVEVPLSLLYRIDSITSLVYHRERRGGLSDESAEELLAVSTRRPHDHQQGGG